MVTYMDFYRLYEHYCKESQKHMSAATEMLIAHDEEGYQRERTESDRLQTVAEEMYSRAMAHFEEKGA